MSAACTDRAPASALGWVLSGLECRRPDISFAGLNKPRGTLPGVVLITLFGLLLASSSRATAPEITVSIDRQSVTVGDPIEYTLSVHYDTNLRMVTPAIGSSLGELDVLHDTALANGRIVNGQRTYIRRLRLAAFQTGTLWTPPLSGELIDSTGLSTPWQTDSLALTVASVLAETDADTADIRALKGQYEVPEHHWLWWAISAALLVALLVAYWLWRRRRHPAETIPAPPPPAWESALRSLHSMREEIDPSSEGGRLWYFRLSEILRRYFDERYGWASIDETTTQIMRRLPTAPFDSGHRERAREFFLLADQVRYAKMAAKLGRPEVDWDWVRALVESTIPPFHNQSEGGLPPTIDPDRSTAEVTR